MAVGPTRGVSSGKQSYLERKVDKSIMMLFLFLFGGAGTSTGYVVWHPKVQATYWFIPVVWSVVALGAGAIFIHKLSRKRDGQWVGWLFGLIALFAVGLLVGAKAT